MNKPQFVRALARGTQDDETYKMVDAVRLMFEKSMSQKEVAQELDISQSSVSRLLGRAQAEGVVRFIITPPAYQELERRMRDRLASLGVRQVDVVPRTVLNRKNEGNLASRGAWALARALEQTKKSDVSITLSCGSTLRSLAREFVSLIRSEPEVQDIMGRFDRLTFYPSALYPNFDLSPIYPASLVISSVLETRQAVRQSASAGPDIRAQAPTLPENFYRALTDREARSEYLTKFGVEAVMEEARNADILVLGVGTGDDKAYGELVDTLHLPASKAPELTSDTPEIVYVPILEDGKPSSDFEDRIVGVRVKDLKKAASDENRHVIVVAGGAGKTRAMRHFLFSQSDAMSWLVTDEDVARSFLDAGDP